MKTYEKPEVKIQTLAAAERLMANECEDETVVALYNSGISGFGEEKLICTFTKNAS